VGPAEVCKTFTTAWDNADRTEVVVFHGEAPTCSENQQIGGFGLANIARVKAGKPRIWVKFAIDMDDIMTMSTVDQRSGRWG